MAETLQASKPPAGQRVWSRVTGSIPSLLGLFFLALYALTAAGRLDSADGRVVAETAEQLLTAHTLRLPPHTADVILGVGGFGYSKYGIAQSLIEIPFVFVGLILRHVLHNPYMVEWTVSFTNVPITALGCVVFYLLLRRLGASTRRAVALTLIYGVATLAWPFSKTDFNEPLQTLSLLTAAYCAVRARQEERLRWLWASGGALAVCILTKAAMSVVVPAFIIYVASADVLVEGRLSLALPRTRAWWISVALRQAALLAPVVVAGAITMWLNLERFGGILNFGYDAAGGDAPFTNPILVGAFGLLFSFNTGLIFYSTPVLLGVFGYRRFARRLPRETVLIVLLALALLILYGGYRYWAGLAAFGPRYLVPLIPFLLLPAIDAFAGASATPRTLRRALVVIGTISVIGVLVQVLGVVNNFGLYSSLTCLRFPCPASLDASQSELLYDIWLLPTTLAYTFLGVPPQVIPGHYPFGTPPVGRRGFQAGLTYTMNYFWFVFVPHARAALLAGGILCGAIMLAVLAGIARRIGLGGSHATGLP